MIKIILDDPWSPFPLTQVELKKVFKALETPLVPSKVWMTEDCFNDLKKWIEDEDSAG